MAKYEFVRPFSTHAVGDVVELPDDVAVASYLKPVVENKEDSQPVEAVVETAQPEAVADSAPDADKEGN